MTFTPREFKITYAGVTVGAGTTRMVERPVELALKHDTFSLTFKLSIAGYADDEAAAFKAECDTIEAAFSKPSQDLSALLVNALTGSTETTLIAFAHSTASGLNVRAEITKDGGEADTARSRRWSVTITGGRPAGNETGYQGLRPTMEWTISTPPNGITELHLSGEVTAQSGGNLALAQYQAIKDTIVGDFQTLAGGGTWEQVNEDVRGDEDNHVARFTLHLRRIRYSQSAGGLDDARVKEPNLTIDVEQPAADGEPDERPWVQLSGSYTAWVDASQMTGTQLRSLWTATILPWIRQNLTEFAGTSTVAITRIAPRYDPDRNQLTATVQGVARGGGDVLSHRVTTMDHTAMGGIFRETWPEPGEVDGEKPTPAYRFQGPVVASREVVTTKTVIGAGGAGGRRGQGGAGGAAVNLLGIFGLGQELHIDFLGPAASPPRAQLAGAAGGVGGAAAGADGATGAAAGGAITWLEDVQRTQHQRLHGVPGVQQILVTDLSVTERYRIAPWPRSGGGGGGLVSQNRADSGIRGQKPPG